MEEEFGVFIRDVDLLYPVDPLLKADEDGKPYEEIVAVIAAKPVKERPYHVQDFKNSRIAIIARAMEGRLTNLVGLRTDHVSLNKNGQIVLRGPRIDTLPSKYI